MITKLGRLVTFKGGSAFPQDQQGNSRGSVPFMKVSDLSRGTGAWKSNTAANWLTDHQLVALRPTVAPRGATVFAKIGEGLKSERCRLADREVAIDNNMMAVIPKDTVYPEFLYYLMKTIGLRNYAVGSALPYLRQGTLAEIDVDIPAFEEQQAVAEVLGALDDKIAANTKLAVTADELVAASFHKALMGASYSNVTFADVAKVTGGGTPSTKEPSYWDGDVPWATPTDVTALPGPYLESTSRTISDAGLAACASELYPAGSILMTSRATIGAFAIAQVPVAVNQGFIVVQANDPGNQYWLFHEMRSRVDEFVSLANGATFLELSRGNFKKFKVRLPEATTVAEFNDLATALHARAREGLRENMALSTMRDTLLPQLMSGKLEVKDVEKLVEATV